MRDEIIEQATSLPLGIFSSITYEDGSHLFLLPPACVQAAVDCSVKRRLWKFEVIREYDTDWHGHACLSIQSSSLRADNTPSSAPGPLPCLTRSRDRWW